MEWSNIMAELIENLFWIIVIVLGIAYLLFVEYIIYKQRKNLKSEITYTKEEIVSMKIVNKVFSKGTIIRIGGSIIPTKLPDTYTIELEYEGNMYEINDKEIFSYYEVGQFVMLKLVKSLDKNKNIIEYELFQLN